MITTWSIKSFSAVSTGELDSLIIHQVVNIPSTGFIKCRSTVWYITLVITLPLPFGNANGD